MANIQVTDLKETLNFKYDVNSTADGSFTGTESPANITMLIYEAATSVSYADASSKTNTGIAGSNDIKGNLAVEVTNNSTIQTTNPIYFDVTITGSNFTSNIANKTLLTTTNPTDGTLAPSAKGTATIEITHSGTVLTDTATITVNLYEKYGNDYIQITPSAPGTVTVTISAAVLGLSTVVTGKSAIDNVYYLRKTDTFNYDITLTNTGNVVSKSTKITIVPDSTNLNTTSVQGTTDSTFATGLVTLEHAKDGSNNDIPNQYVIPVDIEATNGKYYVRVSETVN